MKLSLIAAVARNGAIGRDNALLWHLPQDLAFFKTTTQGCPVLMGRKTWDSLPPRFRPLRGRRNVVLTRDDTWQADGAEVVHSLEEALGLLKDEAQVFVIGGAQLYELALDRADELVLTHVDASFEGDTFFPDWSQAMFKPIWSEDHPASATQPLGWRWARYERVRESE